MAIVLAIAILLALALLGVGIGYALIAAGSVIMLFLLGAENGLTTVGTTLYRGAEVPTYAAVPLFILMGEILLRTGVAERALYAVVGVFRGSRRSLLYSGIAGSAVFAATSGSSVATAATLGKVLWPSMQRLGYDRRNATGSLAAGGTLGILIPPSIIMIVYGSITRESIGQLFMAGVFPGLVMAGGFMVAARLGRGAPPEEATKRSADQVTAEVPQMVASRLAALLPVASLILWVLGSLYFGIATPSESAAVGCIGAIVVALVLRTFRVRQFLEATKSAVVTSAAIMFLFAGASLLSVGFQRSGVIRNVNQVIVHDLGLSAMGTLVAIYLLYIALGMFMDGVSLIVLTVPLTYPILTGLGFDGVWLGIVITILVEMALITPPIGLNLFVLTSVTKVDVMDVARGVAPYAAVMLAVLTLLTVFPDLALWLPGQM